MVSLKRIIYLYSDSNESSDIIYANYFKISTSK